MIPIPPEDPVLELLHLGYHRQVPHPALEHWVEFYFGVQTTLLRPVVETLYPDGGSALVFHFAGTDLPGAWFTASQALSRIRFEGRVDGFGVRFLPGGAHALLGLAPAKLADRHYALAELDLPQTDGLFAALANAGTDGRIRLIEDWLLAHAPGQKTLGPVQKLWRALSRVETNIDDDLSDAGISRRRFERVFRQQTGMSPNKFKML